MLSVHGGLALLQAADPPATSLCGHLRGKQQKLPNTHRSSEVLWLDVTWLAWSLDLPGRMLSPESYTNPTAPVNSFL